MCDTWGSGDLLCMSSTTHYQSARRLPCGSMDRRAITIYHREKMKACVRTLGKMRLRCFWDSLTFHLPMEEKLVGIVPKATNTVEERKNILSAKWRSAAGKCDLEMIRGICGAWYEVDVEYDGNALDIRFISIIGVPPALDALLAAVAGGMSGSYSDWIYHPISEMERSKTDVMGEI